MSAQRILIDGYNLGLDDGTGVATYARNLAWRAHRLGYGVEMLYGAHAAARDALMREVTFFDPYLPPRPAWQIGLRNTIEAVEAPFGLPAAPVDLQGAVLTEGMSFRLPYADRFWNVRDLWGRADRYEFLYGGDVQVRMQPLPDLVHWTYPVSVRVPGAPNIFTIHDLVPLRLPYTTTDSKRRFLRRLRRIVRDAAHIVTVSETSRQDIISLLGVAPDRVTNTYQASDIPPSLLATPEDAARAQVEGVFRLPWKSYFLYFGAIEPKKNIGRLIEAYLASGAHGPLVIAGKLAWKAEQELRLLADGTLNYLEQVDRHILQRQRIRRIDYTPFPLLVALIRGARAVLFPSLYEGFGLPVLEAMQLGTPVMTSRTGALQEVAGDAALLVDPYDTLAMAAAIAALEKQDDLRADLAARGLAQAAIYSAEHYARRVGELYGRLLRPGHGT